MTKMISLFTLLFLASCGGQNPMKSAPAPASFSPQSSSSSYSQRPSLEEMRFSLEDKTSLEYTTDEMFEVEILSSYLVKRYYFNQFLNTKAPIRLASYPLDTPGMIIRLPLGAQQKLPQKSKTQFDLTLLDFPYQDNQLQYVWFDTQEQKEITQRSSVISLSVGNYTTLSQLVLDQTILSTVAPANLRLIIFAVDKNLTTTKISLEGEVTSLNTQDTQLNSEAVDLLKRRDSYQPQLGHQSFWICANCSLNQSQKLYVETNLEKITQAASVGEIFKKEVKSHEVSFEDLRAGDEVEINLSASIQRFDIINRHHSHRIHHIVNDVNFGFGIKSRASTLCEYVYQDITYHLQPVSFEEEQLLEALTIKVDQMQVTGLSYYHHYPHRFSRNLQGQLIMIYRNSSEAKSIQVSFNPQKREQIVHLKGDVTSAAGRSTCFEALNTPAVVAYRPLVHGRDVKIQDVYTLDLSLKVYGAPRI